MGATEFLLANSNSGQTTDFCHFLKGSFLLLIPVALLACSSVPPPESVVQIGGFSPREETCPNSGGR